MLKPTLQRNIDNAALMPRRCYLGYDLIYLLNYCTIRVCRCPVRRWIFSYVLKCLRILTHSIYVVSPVAELICKRRMLLESLPCCRFKDWPNGVCDSVNQLIGFGPYCI